MFMLSSSLVGLILSTCFISKSLAGDVTQSVKLDRKCSGATLHEIRITDCNKFPCTIQRGKNYTVDAEFSLARDVKNPVVRCGTIYLGRQVSLPGHGGCETVTNGTCPLEGGVVYNTFTRFNIPYYVPPMLYTVACRLEDDDGNYLLCGSGSGRVV